MDEAGGSVAEYACDAWGKLVSTAPTSGSIGNINSLRYRGYYYDSETKLYYLQSRYYDPEVCRFINADDYWEEITKTGERLLYYSKTYIEEGVNVIVKIWNSADGLTQKLSDAIPYIIK